MTTGVEHLRAFVAIAEEGNITVAAAVLRKSQPALSRALQQLEVHLGRRLVNRTTHGLELTRDGEALLPRAAAAVKAVDSALDPAQSFRWPLRVGHAWSAFGGFTTPLLREWKLRYPETPLELHRIDDRLAGITSGAVDVAVVRNPHRPPGLCVEPLTSEARLAALPADHPLAGRPSLVPADLARETLVVNTVSGTTTPDLWPAEARPARVVEVANTDDWLTAIASGECVGITGESTAVMHPRRDVVYRPVSGLDPIEVCLAWPDPPTHPAIPDFLAVARSVVGRS